MRQCKDMPTTDYRQDVKIGRLQFVDKIFDFYYLLSEKYTIHLFIIMNFI